MKYSLSSLERRLKALEARRGLSADGELSPLAADASAIKAHGGGLAGLYAWLETAAGREQIQRSVIIIRTETAGGAPCSG
jgi:hypothetical protein